jgi:amidase
MFCDGTQMATTDEALAFAGPAELAALVRSQQVHPRELAELFLRRIEALDPKLNAFRTTMPDEALAAAEELAGSDGLLAGVPVAVKDEMAVAGQFLTRGSRSYGPAETSDSEIVRRLRAAGAIPIGITNVPELMAWPWTASEANGITRNPWDPTRTPGGSSGGSAAAVAAGMVPAASAADGGGSIRIPAASCGIVGMKPTRGRVSLQPLADDWLGLTVYGALARTVRDSALLLDAIHGSASGDADAAPRFDGSYLDAAERPPGRLRIAASQKIPPGIIASLSSDQRRAFEDTATLLDELGHEVSSRDPAYGFAGILFTQMWFRGVYEEAVRVPDHSKLERYTRQYVRAGRYVVPDRRRERLIARSAAFSQRVLKLWDEIDVLVTPGLASTAIAAEGGYGRSAFAAFNISARFSPWTAPFNMSGQPAIAIPAGFSDDGLPLSVQLVGRMGAEDVLYSLAAQIEAAKPWADRRPPLAFERDPGSG